MCFGPDRVSFDVPAPQWEKFSGCVLPWQFRGAFFSVLGMSSSDARDLVAEPVQHRTGETHFLGKCDESLEISLPAQMKADLAAMAQLSTNHKNPSALARRILSDFLYGRVKSMRGSIEE